MIPVPGLTPSDPTVRTQITLTAQLKRFVEQAAAAQEQSLSGYLRRAAALQLFLDSEKSARLARLADRVIGSLDLSRHPRWQTRRGLNSWIRKLRREWQ